MSRLAAGLTCALALVAMTGCDGLLLTPDPPRGPSTGGVGQSCSFSGCYHRPAGTGYCLSLLAGRRADFGVEPIRAERGADVMSHIRASAGRFDVRVQAVNILGFRLPRSCPHAFTAVAATGCPDSVSATVRVGNRPIGPAATPDGRFVYVSNCHGNSVSVIQTGDDTVAATVPVGNVPRGVAVLPSGRLQWRS